MDLLSQQIKNGKVSNAYIFEGNSENHNLEEAVEFAKQIFLSKGLEIDDKNNSDLIIIDKANDSILLADAKAVVKDMYLRPNNGIIKVYIFHNSQNLRLESSNALLKSIEEPSDYSIVIFTTTNAYSLLPTIRSRCQIIKLDSKRDIYSIDREKLDEILANVLIGKLDYYYKNKDFFQNHKEEKEDLFALILDFFERLLYYKYLEENKEDNGSYYIRMVKDISFESIEDIVKQIEEIRLAFNFNINYELSIEKLIFHIYRKARKV